MFGNTLDDLILIVEWLSATKTLPVPVAEAMARLKQRAHLPVDVKLEIAATGKGSPDVNDSS